MNAFKTILMALAVFVSSASLTSANAQQMNPMGGMTNPMGMMSNPMMVPMMNPATYTQWYNAWMKRYGEAMIPAPGSDATN